MWKRRVVKRPIGNSTAVSGLAVQYGAGPSAVPGWMNFDSSPTIRLQRVPLLSRAAGAIQFDADIIFGDVVRGLPLADGSCRAVYASHVLEHLSLADLRKALRETLRVLQRAGVFRLVVPDLEFETRAYLSSSSAERCHVFMKATALGQEVAPRGLEGRLRSTFGNSQHRWMWDEQGLTSELRSAGFVGVRRAQIGDAADPAFEQIERPDRWRNCLGLEAIRN